jgi:hypothetical protein
MSKENEECNEKMYIEMSKKNIDHFIYNSNYKSAFGLFISVIERLDDKERDQFIKDYSNHLIQIMMTPREYGKYTVETQMLP